MKKPGRKSQIILISSVILAFAILMALRYLPFSKILRVSKVSEQAYSTPEAGKYTAPRSILFDFEVAEGKDVPGGLEKGFAHSGQYAAKAFGKNTFTAAIERTIEEVGPDNLKGVGASAWIFVKPGSEKVSAAMVFSASNALGVNLCWKGITVKDPGVPRGKWFKISGFFDLTDQNFKPGTKMQIYFWNNSSTDILVDDYYIVFGGPMPRRGDSSLVDLTRAAFVPRFNFPPFPSRFLVKEETGKSGDALVSAGGGLTSFGDDPEARVISGDFTGERGTEQILVAGAKGQLSVYAWCKTKECMTGILLEGPAGEKLPEGPLVPEKGLFIKGKPELILLKGSSEACVISLNVSSAAFCRGAEPGSAKYTILWKGQLPQSAAESKYIVADVNGDGISELLSVGKKGEWAASQLSSAAARPSGAASQQSLAAARPSVVKAASQPSLAGWGKIAEGNEESLPEWDNSKYDFTVSAGKFKNSGGVQLLTVFRDRKTGVCGYTLRRYDAGKRSMVSLIPAGGLSGKIIGLDTLKAEDHFIFMHEGGKNTILRYNRDWRFDLKQIIFNDTTYQVICNLDFKGYSEDHNPKYFGELRMIKGCFRSAGNDELLVIGRNLKQVSKEQPGARAYEFLKELPDFTAFYKLSPVK